MTRPDLTAIEARAHAATPGPWRADGNEIVGPTGASVLRAWGEHAFDYGLEATEEDLVFIANARTDVGTLTARVRELEAAARRAVDECGAEVCGRDALRVLDDLEAVLDAKESP